MPNGRVIPVPANADLVTFTINIDGVAIPPTFQILSIAVSKEVNRVPKASITILDGDPADESFTASSSDLFVPGKAIDIHMGYHSEEQGIFKGVIVRQSLRVRENQSRLVVDCRDEAFKMTIARKSRYFEETKDSDVFETIIGEYGLGKDVEDSSVEHQELVQYESTDWDFIVSRADANGQFCLVDDGKLTIAKPNFSQEAVVTTVFGATILELDAEMDARHQYEGVRSESWDMGSQEVLETEASEPAYDGPGNLSASDLSTSLGQPVAELQHAGNLKQEELKAWADAKLQRSRLAKIQGRVRFQGFAEIKPGMMIELDGLGDRFSGKAFVSGIMHQMGDGNWTTDVQFGLDEKWYAKDMDISHAAAAHLLPAVQGLQIGMVTVLENDPEGEDRIKVRLPIINAQDEGTWARLACLDAGENRGMFFRPEIGDEVIVGFINGDPRDAVILGSLHSSAKPTPEPIADDNFRKGFISKTELKVLLDDEKKSITLETPGGNMLILDDDAESITLEDMHGNKITMDSNGITMETSANIEIKASQDLKVEGLNVDLAAQVALKAEGSATAELSAGGTTTVKGGLVQIN